MFLSNDAFILNMRGGKQVSKTLAQLRDERRLTQRALAHELGVSPAAIGNYESGKRIPRYGMLKRIADFFGVAIDDLLFCPSAHEMTANGGGHSDGVCD